MAGFDLLIRGGTALTPAGRERTDVAVREGRIAAIGDLSRAAAETTIDAKGLHVLPGLIDTQVHFREPGLEHKEDFESGTRAAVAGGIAGVFDMPNTRPAITDADTYARKLEGVAGRSWCDHGHYVGASGDNCETLAALEPLPGCCGVKMFMGSSTGDLLVAGEEAQRRVMAAGRRRVAVHCEDEARLRERRPLAEAGGDVARHPLWRDEACALNATRAIVGLAREAGRRVHILHVTTAEEMDFLGAHKDIATVEVTPQHLTLAAPDCYAELGTLAQMNPPIRDARHRERLWRALGEGVVDVIGSDHAPHTLAEKARAYPDTPSGMPGVQTLVPIMLDHVHAGRLTLERLVALLAGNPARIFGIAGKGRIAVGCDGDFTIVDLEARRAITGDWLVGKCGWSPFLDRTVTGWPLATVVRGHVAMREGELLDAPEGAPMRFEEALRA